MQQNEWRWWLLHSASQFALIYCYPVALYVLIALSGATAAWLVHKIVRGGGGYCHRKVAGIELLCHHNRYPADAAPNPPAAELYAY